MTPAKKDQTPDAVASTADNARLEHSQGGVTTRDDATDVGVPMLPGDPKEPQGPEDALGEGPKRGDYTGRVGPGDYNPTQTVPVPDAKEGEPNVVVVDQRANTADIGDEAGKKGGVETGPDRR